MKKILNLTLIALLGMAATAYSQSTPKQKFIIAKGSKAFTGRVNFAYSKYSAWSNSFQVGIGEQEGFFVANNLSIGTSVGYDFARYFASTGETRTVEMRHTPTLGINLRYYKMFTEKFGFFVQFTPSGGFAYAHTKQNNDYGPVVITNNYSGFFDISVTPNLVFFVTRKFALEANFGRLAYRQTFAKGTPFSGKNVELGVSPSLSLGMTFYLGKGVQAKS